MFYPLSKPNTDKLASELADYDVPVESVVLEDNHADMP